MLQVTINHFFILSFILFAIGLVGLAFNRKSLISLLMSIELILLSANINFVASSAFTGNIEGQVYTFFVLTLAAGEIAIGLALLVALYKKTKSIELIDMK